ncbi:tRNA 2-selenouridine synthase [Campylobacter sp. CCUG 57310]|uniref:tRNA 2-selenouridine synthase n=1 Tax=Campylobacter sp. CCUG 57310 TaxID=2517362 RepID=UPI00156674CA|nr:tRNA 2-selenouridine synthase [Campylobacter sp. CCUG 57310]QKF91446.1 hypothetical protein CORI_0210 [Campylobacter sp. CCUG 57310]
MKFILAMLSIICLIFLTGCSAKDTNNINKKELEELANKYGGVYIFNKKYLEEIEKREEERKNLSAELGDKIRKKIGKHTYSIDMKPIDKKLPQILSNGKRYYTYWTHYENETGKTAVIPQIYVDKIKKFIGLENYNKYKPDMLLSYFYIDKNNEIIPVSISVYYNVINTEYGIFGDEGAGISFTKKTVKDLGGFNKFYLE